MSSPPLFKCTETLVIHTALTLNHLLFLNMRYQVKVTISASQFQLQQKMWEVLLTKWLSLALSCSNVLKI